LKKAKRHIYAIALGSNQPRSRILTPRKLVEQAIDRLSRKPFHALAASRILDTPPLGQSRRRYANATMLIETELAPDRLLKRLKRMEHKAGRRRSMRWAARPLDLDIVLWSGGFWADDGLIIPHPAFRERDFVLAPLTQIAPGWRDPFSGRTISQLRACLKKARKKAEAG
tara:strand:+ start:42149 stop:42658 length:510 start_codon:yes stop_codon:yes gene_type:complete